VWLQFPGHPGGHPDNRGLRHIVIEVAQVIAERSGDGIDDQPPSLRDHQWRGKPAGNEMRS
jgi:hypothetical protein